MEKIAVPGVKASAIKPNVHDIALEVLKIGLVQIDARQMTAESAPLCLADTAYKIARAMVSRGEQEEVPKAAHHAFRAEVEKARKVWLDENPGEDGTDRVTPFDQFLYR